MTQNAWQNADTNIQYRILNAFNKRKHLARTNYYYN